MKKICLCIIFLLAFGIGISSAEILGDINNDGDVGLPEAVYALGVTAGINQTTVIQDQIFDMAEYMPAPGSTKYFNRKSYANGEETEAFDVYSYALQTVDGQEMLAEVTETESGYWGDVCYYQIGATDVQYIGYDTKDLNGEPSYTGRYFPPIILGSRTQRFREKIPNAYVVVRIDSNLDQSNPYHERHSLEYREYDFLGTEDVTVPAGEFKNCIKILYKRNDGRTQVSYKCKGVGTVKTIRVNLSSSSSPSYTAELLNMERADGTLLSEAVVCMAQGTIATNADGQIFDRFNMSYVSQSTPVYSNMFFLNSSLPPLGWLKLKSDDGINFIPDPAVYPDNPLQFFLTVNGETISGQAGPDSTINGTMKCAGN